MFGPRNDDPIVEVLFLGAPYYGKEPLETSYYKSLPKYCSYVILVRLYA